MIDWQPIASAPKDRRVLLYFPDLPEWARVQCGRWDAHQYVKKPMPYWTWDAVRSFGVRLLRSHPPTHWAEINAPSSD